MATFSRTTRALETEGSGKWGWLLAGSLIVLGAWTAWFLGGRLSVYAVSVSARLVAEGEAHPVSAQAGGRVVSSTLELGREVQRGEVLVELDAAVPRLALEEERVRRASLEPQVAALLGELGAEERALSEARGSRVATLAEARAQVEQAEAAAKLAREQANRSERLKEGVAEMDLLRARTEADELRAAADAATHSTTRKEWEQREDDSSRRARLQRLRRELAALEGDLSRAAVAILRLEQELELRRLRAPVAGRLGGVADLRIGHVLREGEQVAVVVPPGEVQVVADYAPADALGRVRPGQPARVRLDGFPWSQYGSLPAVVTRVASAVRDGRVRVELALQTPEASRIPLAHALPGVAEVELERVAPAVLVLRAAGQLLEGGELGAGAPATGPGAAPTVEVVVRGHTLHAEVAADPESRQRGLTFRRAPGEDGGMLFVFPEDRPLSFWMRNVDTPLSVAFLDAEGRVVNVADMAANDERAAYESAGPARYALEVAQGWFGSRGVRAGDRVELRLPAGLEVR